MKSCKSIWSIMNYWTSQKPGCCLRNAGWEDGALLQHLPQEGQVLRLGHQASHRDLPLGGSRVCGRWMGNQEEQGSGTPRGPLSDHPGLSWAISLSDSHRGYSLSQCPHVSLELVSDYGYTWPSP